MLAPPTDLQQPINHVFVDFENVHQIDLSVIGAKSVYFTLLLGAQQKRLDAELVEKLMEHATSVQLIRLTSSGKNALDFALAYHVGRAVMTDPTAYFHIVSKDKGFDPLIEYMKSRHLRVNRHDDFSKLTFSFRPKPPAAIDSDLPARVLAHLRKNTKNRPKRRKTLESHLEAFTGRNGTKVDVGRLIQSLISADHLNIGEKGGVTYTL
jgi:hypothetical protein